MILVLIFSIARNVDNSTKDVISRHVDLMILTHSVSTLCISLPAFRAGSLYWDRCNDHYPMNYARASLVSRSRFPSNLWGATEKYFLLAVKPFKNINRFSALLCCVILLFLCLIISVPHLFFCFFSSFCPLFVWIKKSIRATFGMIDECARWSRLSRLQRSDCSRASRHRSVPSLLRILQVSIRRFHHSYSCNQNSFDNFDLRFFQGEGIA